MYVCMYVCICIQCEQQTLKYNSDMRLHYLNKYANIILQHFARLKFKDTP